MVDKASSSSSLFLWSKSAWVEARTTCDHLASLSSDLTHFPTLDTPCNRCHHPDDNWLCLCCKDVLCSRYVNKHMLDHFQQSKHCVALGYNDLSVWCHLCNAYLDAQVILPLRPVYETVYRLKFGEAREAPPSQAIEYLQIEDKKAEVSTSGTEELSSNKLDAAKVRRTLRDAQPSHYMFKIESLSVLLKTENGNIESDVFETGGYKWKLSFYPNGNNKRNGKDHISLFLAISDTNNLPSGWEVHVKFKLFVFDHIRDNYLTVEDAKPVLRRFHIMKTEWGFEKFLSLEKFQNPSNGYLLDDTCVFGAEVFVIKFAGKGECLSIKALSDNSTYTWTVDHFSALSNQLYSGEFNIGGRNWKLLLYPKGQGDDEGKSLSLYLAVADSEKNYLKSAKLYAKYKLRIRDQVNGKHREGEASVRFSAADLSWGFQSFKSLSELYDKSKGFMVNDTVIIEAEFTMLSVTKNLT
ncbi:uncharacterized protein LOC132299753 isoform X3 [Cornus florida]|uniref:uncharacterized protein LOC132299753 isoform X3 n=1 Tax=Cornus florida TaxID=4283 RepID=UPI0028A06974|nr:uncharacterized protein LOC132299753 isoform X3 [Cornus florida]